MDNFTCSPIAVFAYKRVDLLEKTLNALKSNKLSDESVLYVFSDGAKTADDMPAVNDVRKMVRSFDGFKRIELIEREENYGLAKNIVGGVSHVLSEHESVIVLEDDLLTGEHFLSFMNKGLDLYKDSNNVCQITGYSYLENYSDNYDLEDLYFIKGGDCLAWGTWKRAWEYYNPDSAFLLETIKSKHLTKEFNRNNSYNYLKMLKQNAQGKVNSWAINWYASTFLNNMYSLYPLKSLALHIGNDASATNYTKNSKEDPLDVSLSNELVKMDVIPVSETENTKRAFDKFLSNSRGSFLTRLSVKFKKRFCFPLSFIKRFREKS